MGLGLYWVHFGFKSYIESILESLLSHIWSLGHFEPILDLGVILGPNLVWGSLSVNFWFKGYLDFISGLGFFLCTVLVWGF